MSEPFETPDVTWTTVSGDGIIGFLFAYKETARPAWQRRLSWLVRRWRGPIITEVVLPTEPA